jgi:rSAM/selenodomain-associated transferase 2
MSSRIAIILPVLNEEARIVACLNFLQPLRGQDCELIVVDGGSGDRAMTLAEPLADRVMTGPRGRAAQMNAGARLASGDILWFLHADSLPPPNAATLLRAALAPPNRHWGRFDVRLSGRHPLLRVVETSMNVRSRFTGIATGDQGIFARREVFERVGGYPPIALMEDIALSRLLKRHGQPVCLRQRLTTSSRRWEQDGILRTILLMWRLRLAYFLGADPDRLARIYYRP